MNGHGPQGVDEAVNALAAQAHELQRKRLTLESEEQRLLTEIARVAQAIEDEKQEQKQHAQTMQAVKESTDALIKSIAATEKGMGAAHGERSRTQQTFANVQDKLARISADLEGNARKDADTLDCMQRHR